MKVLIFNEFTSIPGGTDEVVNMEVELLKSSGTKIKLISYKNSELLGSPFFIRIKTLASSIYGSTLRDMVQNEVDAYKPDIIHFHNVYQIFRSPVWNEINPRKAKMILHIHNFYPFCLNSLMYKNGFCNKCYTRNSWIPGIFHKCYNNSYFLSLLSGTNRIHPMEWINNTSKLSKIVVVSQFLFDKLVEHGVSYSKISIIPNCAPIHEISSPGNFILYLGNIASEKGIDTFCKTAVRLPFFSFIAAGDGRELPNVKKRYAAVKNLQFTGYADSGVRAELLRGCRFLYFPTHCFETFGMVILEAFSYGKPVLTTASGAIGELVINGKTGAINSFQSIESQVNSIVDFWNTLDNNFEYSKNCIETARKYSPARHLQQLKELYSMM